MDDLNEKKQDKKGLEVEMIIQLALLEREYITEEDLYTILEILQRNNFYDPMYSIEIPSEGFNKAFSYFTLNCKHSNIKPGCDKTAIFKVPSDFVGFYPELYPVYNNLMDYEKGLINYIIDESLQKTDKDRLEKKDLFLGEIERQAISLNKAKEESLSKKTNDEKTSIRDLKKESKRCDLNDTYNYYFNFDLIEKGPQFLRT